MSGLDQPRERTAPLGVAVLGCGYWGVNYVRVMSELPGVRVVAVCDERIARLHEIGKRFPHAYLTPTLEDALQTDGVEAVVVCTGAQTHHDVTSRCLAAGKHVLVEKPVTTTSLDADALIESAAQRDLTLMVGHTFLYNAGVRKVKEYLTNGAVGQVYYLYARRTSLGPIRQDVNALWDLAPHDVSIFNHLLGMQPEWVSAVGAKVLRNSREDVGFISLGYPGGIVGHIHVSWADPNKTREVVVVGSNKRIVFNDLDALEQVRVFDKGVEHVPVEASTYGEHTFLLRDGDIVSPAIEVSEPLKNQCMHFVECVVNGETPATDGPAGRDVVQVMEAIDRSLELRGAPVAVRKGEIDGDRDRDAAHSAG